MRAEAAGDITPSDPGQTDSGIVWAHATGGTYVQTPIAVGNLLFGCGDGGKVTCYDAATGAVKYTQRLGTGGARVHRVTRLRRAAVYSPANRASSSCWRRRTNTRSQVPTVYMKPAWRRGNGRWHALLPDPGEVNRGWCCERRARLIPPVLKLWAIPPRKEAVKGMTDVEYPRLAARSCSTNQRLRERSYNGR